MNFVNKTVIVTGGAKGIGNACARLFFQNGANTVLLDLTKDNTIDNEKWVSLICDVSDEEQVKNAIKSTIEIFGAIDILINNAGIQMYGTITETSSEDWDRLFNVNLRSMFLSSKYAIPYLLHNSQGIIINIASVQAFLSQKRVASYTTAKTAVLGLTRSIAIDYAPHIRCLAICPGTIDTPMLRDSFALSSNPDEVMQECVQMHPVGRIGQPEEVADLIGFLCSDKAGFINGQAIRIDGGLGITIGGSKRD